MKVSIVIAVEEVTDLARENIAHCLTMSFADFEILLFVSHETDESFAKTRIIVRSDLAFNPAQRRDLAIDEAQGEILAFIDDDAYPSRDWLAQAIAYFDDPAIAAVGGPGVTPPADNVRKQVSGWSSASPLGGGPSAAYRFIPGRKREVDDYPSMNLIVRKSDFAMVGGFDSNYWPGEDTKLCSDLTLKIGKRIIYDPEVLVYHHRRAIFKDHLRQNGRYGFHRGHFARVLPQTSRKLAYFLPSIFTVFLFAGLIFSLISFLVNPLPFPLPRLRFLLLTSYCLLLTSYFLLLLLNSLWVWKRCRNYKMALLTIPTIFLTHFWYGVQFIFGLTVGKIKR